MSEFDFTISHIPGKANVVADVLSRCCDLDPTSCATVMMGTKSDLLDMIRRAQEQDQTISFGNQKERALTNEHGMCMHEGLVCRKLHTGG